MSEPQNDFGLLLSATVDIGTRLDSASKAMRQPKPLDQGHRVFGSGTVPASGQNPFLLVPQSEPAGPASGMVWNVRAVKVTGTIDAHTPVTGTPEFYCGPPPTENLNAITPNFLDWIVSGAAIPFTTDLSRHVYWAKPSDMPYALIWGASPGTVLFFEAIVEVWRVEDVLRMTI